jgi:hypothetical protein
MSIEEQKQIKTKYYNEAIRYIDNAEKSLKQAGKEGRYYKNDKYVKVASVKAYSAILLALDGLFKIKNIPNPKGGKNKKHYVDNLNWNKSLNRDFETAYTALHLDGYYSGITLIKLIDGGFEVAYSIIEKIKP